MAATLDGWIAYAEARGDEVYMSAASSAALVRAQDYIVHHYQSRFAGGVAVDEAVLDAATYEAARLELETPNLFSTTYTPEQAKVLTQVGDIRWQVVGGATGVEAAMPVSTKIEAMLRPYLVTYAGAWVV